MADLASGQAQGSSNLVDPGDSQEIAEEESQDVDSCKCKCGFYHGSKANGGEKPHARFTQDEVARLSLTVVDNSIRKWVVDYLHPKDRAAIDDKDAPDVWFLQPQLPFKDAHLLDTANKDLLFPSKVPAHTRLPGVLKQQWSDLKPKVTKWNENYSKSGQMDPESIGGSPPKQ
eukprot:7060434-Pyramimonas_sp.AAC.1